MCPVRGDPNRWPTPECNNGTYWYSLHVHTWRLKYVLKQNCFKYLTYTLITNTFHVKVLHLMLTCHCTQTSPCAVGSACWLPRWITKCAFVGLQCIQSACCTDMEHVQPLFVLRAIQNAPSFARRATGSLIGRSGATLGRN